MTKFNKKDKLTILLGVVLSLELLLLLYFLFFHLDVVDPDFALILRHSEEIAKNRTFFLRDWKYSTNGEFDSPLFFAVPLYILTGKIFVSWAISHVLTIIVYLVFVYSILRRAGVGIKYRLLALITICAFWSPDAIRYADMMFFNGAWYAYRVFIPLLLVAILTDPALPKIKLRNSIMLAAYFFLLFLTSMSSGTHGLLCGVLPIAVCEMVFIVRGYRKGPGCLYVIMGAGSFAATGLGLYFNRIMDVESRTYKLHGLYKIAESAIPSCSDLLDLFVPFSHIDHVDVVLDPLSLHGIIQLMCLAMGLVIVLFGLLSLKKCVYISADKKPEGDKEISTKLHIEGLLIGVFMWNLAVVLLTTQSLPRYHLIGMIPLVLCAAINMERFFVEKNGRILFFSEKSALVIYASFFLIYGVFILSFAQTEYFHRFDQRNMILSEAEQLMEENDAGTLFASERGLVETMRFLYPDKAFIEYDPETEGVIINQHFYRYACDRSGFTDRNILMMSVEDSNAKAEAFPNYIVENYELLTEKYGYRFFISEHCALDGLAGFPAIDHSIDLASTPGYKYNGDIDGSGALHNSSTGDILISPELDSDGKRSFELIVHYVAEPETSAVLYLYNDGELMSEYPLDNTKYELAVEFPAVRGAYSFRIENKSGGPISIGTMDFDATSPK